MDVLKHLKSDQTISLPTVVTAFSFFLAISWYFRRQASIERPLPGFPLVGLEEEGLSPRDAWSQHGHKVQAKGLREHAGAFQVMTATGPKVRCIFLNPGEMLPAPS